MRRALLNTALVGATLAALFLVGECGLRVAAGRAGPLARQPLPAEWQGLPEVVGTQALLARNVRGVRNGALFETNRAGLRGPLRSRRKPPGVYRIVLIGDSFAMGEGVVYADTYGARLERQLNTEQARPRVELINVAVSGLATTGIVNRFDNVGAKYDPDLVIYGYTVNDIEGPEYRVSVDPAFTNPLYYQESPSYLVRYLAPRGRMLLELLAAPRGSYSYELDDNYFENPAAFRQLEDGLDRLQRAAARDGFCAVVLVHSQLWALHGFHPFSRHYAAVSAAAEARGFVAVEALPHFVELPPRDGQEYWIHYNDSHPNAEGHAVLATALREGLDALPARCWPPRATKKAGS